VILISMQKGFAQKKKKRKQGKEDENDSLTSCVALFCCIDASYLNIIYIIYTHIPPNWWWWWLIKRLGDNIIMALMVRYLMWELRYNVWLSHMPAMNKLQYCALLSSLWHYWDHSGLGRYWLKEEYPSKVHFLVLFYFITSLQLKSFWITSWSSLTRLDHTGCGEILCMSWMYLHIFLPLNYLLLFSFSWHVKASL